MFARFELKEDFRHLAAWAGIDATKATVPSIKPLASLENGVHRRRSHPVVRISPVTKKREIVWMREGLIPSYAGDERGADERAEAHAEAMNCDSCFRSAFRRRRCFIPANVLHENRHLSSEIEQPCSFALESGGLFAMAGVWETWTNDQGHAVESFAMITALVTPVLRTLFHRMPVVLSDPEDRDRWLRPAKDEEHLPVDLMQPLSSARLREWKMMPGPVDMHLEDDSYRRETEASALS
jgi:putative SOS response-associated peptidase YedK